MKKFLIASAFAALAAAPTVASAQSCTAATTMTALASYVDCAGAFSGNLNGSAGELSLLSTEFGGTWFYHGKSDNMGGDPNPFTMNPTGTSGTLNFDAPVFGLFVVGLKASNTYSFYLYDGGATGISSLPFETIGSATNNQGMAQGLSHAALYSVDNTPFINDCVPGAAGCQITTPEPSTYVLMGTGLLALGFASRRRRKA